MIRPSVWKTEIDPEICNICQTTQGERYGHCSNRNTVHLNQAMDQYADLRFGIGLNLDFETNAEFAFYPVDMDRWQPNLLIPEQYIYQRTRKDSLLIYHSVIGKHRGNIKGTQWIVETIEELQQMGYNIELIYIERTPNDVIRYYQAQADIVIDQLLLGGGGQTSRECMALGKPVLTRMHSPQIDSFKKAASPHDPPPYIATERKNLKENLIQLIENPNLRAEYGQKSLAFAQNCLTPEKCAAKYLEHYQQLF